MPFEAFLTLGSGCLKPIYFSENIGLATYYLFRSRRDIQMRKRDRKALSQIVFIIGNKRHFQCAILMRRQKNMIQYSPFPADLKNPISGLFDPLPFCPVIL